jgi:hypothetical protein
MNRRRHLVAWRAWLASVLLGVFLGGCQRCDESAQKPTIATLGALVGDGVARDFAEQVGKWEKAHAGAKLGLGDGAQTDAKSTAELRFVNGASLALKPNTTVRLLLDSEQQQTSFDVQSGEAVLRAGKAGVSLRTHVGLAQIAPDSEIWLRREGDSLGFEVALGQLNFRDRDSAAVDLQRGDSVDVGIGMAVLELTRATPGPGTPEATDISVEVQQGEVRASGAGGSYARTLASGAHAVTRGTHLRLPAGAVVIVKRGLERVHLRGAGDFVVGVENALAESRRGAMHLKALEVDVEVRVPGGVIIARKSASGTQAEVTVGDHDGQLSVAQGSVAARLLGHDEELLAAGDERTWALSGEPVGEDDPAGTQAGPAYRHMTARAGESFVVHTPSAPVAVGFDFGSKCAGEAQLELLGAKQKARAAGSANLLLPAGSRGYALRCVGDNGVPGKIVARGNVHVLVDPGTRKLPPRAPTSNIEADGRTYTIYYQNQLPEVFVRWPGAPVQQKYVLELDHKPIELTEPEYLFRSGTLADGSHELVFSAQGRRSRTTTVQVNFDNVAPKASLMGPDDRSFTPGQLVTVEGVALPTWKVALEGGSIAMSGGDRFSGQVQTSAERPDVAVRLSHPRLGTHYYLRRASGTP